MLVHESRSSFEQILSLESSFKQYLSFSNVGDPGDERMLDLTKGGKMLRWMKFEFGNPSAIATVSRTVGIVGGEDSWQHYVCRGFHHES